MPRRRLNDGAISRLPEQQPLNADGVIGIHEAELVAFAFHAHLQLRAELPALAQAPALETAAGALEPGVVGAHAHAVERIHAVAQFCAEASARIQPGVCGVTR